MAGPPQPPLERHTEYYLEDASDVFRVREQNPHYTHTDLVNCIG